MLTGNFLGRHDHLCGQERGVWVGDLLLVHMCCSVCAASAVRVGTACAQHMLLPTHNHTYAPCPQTTTPHTPPTHTYTP